MERYEVEKIIKLLDSGEEYFTEDDPKGEYLVFGYDSIQKKYYIRRTDTIAGSYDETKYYTSNLSLLEILLTL